MNENECRATVSFVRVFCRAAAREFKKSLQIVRLTQSHTTPDRTDGQYSMGRRHLSCAIPFMLFEGVGGGLRKHACHARIALVSIDGKGEPNCSNHAVAIICPRHSS